MNKIDHDNFEAIKAQARLGHDPIMQLQIEHVYNIGRRSMHEELTPTLTRLGDIAINLGTRAPPIDAKFMACKLCHNKTNGAVTDLMLQPERHKKTCTWRLANEWVTEMRASNER